MKKLLYICVLLISIGASSRANATTISGSTVVCTGLSTPFTIDTTGGAWSSSNPARATVDAGTGIVTGISAGTAIISYSLVGATFTRVVNVHTQPSGITGTDIICQTAFTNLSNPMGTLGTWSSGNTSVATIVSNGKATGVSGGTAMITYRVTASGCFTTREITINPLPSVITNPGATCPGGTIALVSAPAGGIWTSANPAVASVNAATGAATAVSSGLTSNYLVTVSYTLPTGCRRVTQVTVNSTPGTVIGTLSLCTGSTSALFSGSPGGAWSSSDIDVATISAGGTVTGISTGTSTISYTMAGGCASSVVVTVTAPAAANTGNSIICIGQTTTLSNATPGGTWSSSATSKASVNSGTGVVMGVASGTANITYNMGAGCNTITTVTVAGTAAITGTAKACAGTSTTLAYGVGGGTWSSTDTTIATINSVTGAVAGVATGITNVTYTLNPGCIRTVAVTVNNAPAANSGTLMACVGAQTTLSNPTGGGTWSSNIPGIASVASNGKVTGISGGNALISYKVTATGCSAVSEVTISPLPAVISNPAAICPGSTEVFSTTPTGGVWTSSNAAVATVDPSSGAVTATGGSSSALLLAVVSYTLPAGCLRTTQVTVNTQPGIIVGNTTLCAGHTSALTSGTPGGTWSSASEEVATISATGIVSAISTGTSVIAYTVGTGCARTTTINVNPGLEANGGYNVVCIGQPITLSNEAGGGTWASSNTTKAIVNTATGVVTGIAPGTVNITYSLGSGCFSVSEITVNSAMPAITGSHTVCEHGEAELTHELAGGFWSTESENVNISESGTMTGTSAGTAVVTYTMEYGCSKTTTVTVNPLAAIDGSSGLCSGSFLTLSGAPTGGTWSSADNEIATVNPGTGKVYGITGGEVAIIYTLPTGCANDFDIRITATPTDAGEITGPSTVNAGLTIELGNSTESSGTWSSENTAIATIDESGILTGFGAGTVTISFVISNSCGSVTATTNITVVTPANGLHFDGVNDVVLIGSPLPTGSSYTKEAWVFSNSNAINANIISSLNAPFWINTGYLKAGQAGSYVLVADATPIPENTWVHVAVTYDAATTTMKLYRNGSLVATNSAVSGYTTETTQLGAHFSTVSLLQGALDEVRIWNRALCGDELQNNMNCQLALPQTGLLVYYRLNQGIANGTNTGVATAYDSSGNGNNGTLRNFALSGTTSNWVSGTTSGSCTVWNRPEVSITFDGPTTICTGGSLLLTATGAPTGYAMQWKRNGSTLSGATNSTYNATESGTFTVSITGPGGCFVVSDGVLVSFTSSPDAGSISGGSAVGVGGTLSLSSTSGGGVWSSSNNEVASINAEGVVSGITSGSVTISYIVFTSCGNDTSSTPVFVGVTKPGSTAADQNEILQVIPFAVTPNPSHGLLSIRAPSAGSITLYTIDGREIKHYFTKTVQSSITLPASLARGVYLLRFRGADGSNMIEKVVFEP